MTNTTSNDPPTSTAIVAKDDIDVITRMVLDNEQDHDAALAREANEKVVAVRTNKLFLSKLIANTTNPEDHEKIKQMQKEAAEIAKASVFKAVGAQRGKTPVDMEDEPQEKQKKKRKQPSNGGITGMNVHHMIYSAEVKAMGFRKKDVLGELTGRWTKLSAEGKLPFNVEAKAVSLFIQERGSEFVPPACTVEARKEALKTAWSVLEETEKAKYRERVAEGANVGPIPPLAPRGEGAEWDARWERRAADGDDAAVDDHTNDALDDDDVAQPPPARKKAKKPKSHGASVRAS